MSLKHARIGLAMQLAIIIGLIRIISAVQCEHCGKDFVSLGRHAWRCTARVTSSARPLHAVDPPLMDPTAQHHAPPPVDPPIPPPQGPDAPEDVLCPCGRHCKGRRGLKAHQRSCGFFKTLVQGGLLDPSGSDPPQPTPSTASPMGPPRLLHPLPTAGQSSLV